MRVTTSNKARQELEKIGGQIEDMANAVRASLSHIPPDDEGADSYIVGLDVKDLPDYEVKANSPDEAKQKYVRKMGIVHTARKFVIKVKDDRVMKDQAGTDPDIELPPVEEKPAKKEHKKKH